MVGIESPILLVKEQKLRSMKKFMKVPTGGDITHSRPWIPTSPGALRKGPLSHLAEEMRAGTQLAELVGKEKMSRARASAGFRWSSDV